MLFTSGIFPVSAQFYNGSQLEFGKNRVQYIDFLWSFYRYEKFDTYFYLGGKELSVYTAKKANDYMETLEKQLDYMLDERIQFIIYNKYSDFKQSNIGLVSDPQYNIGGITQIVGTKVFLYFNGDHHDFERQIRAGIATVMIDQMMYGGSVKDVIRNSALLTLPEWYMKGLIAYLSEDWNSTIENRVKDGILTRKFEKFNRLSGEDAVYAGYSLWHFIAETYGNSVISNIIYMAKVSRNIDSGFLFVLGVSLQNLSFEWLDFYDKMYYAANKNLALPEEKPLLKRSKTGVVFSQMKISPDGKHIVYTSNDKGLYKVFMHDLSTGKRKKIMKAEFRADRKPDLSYPLITWHPTGKLFSIFTEKKGKNILTNYTLETKKKASRQIFQLEKILDASFSPDGKKYAISGVLAGQSDIFVYTIAANTIENITKDIYDDRSPRFVNGNDEIVFSSNRRNDTLMVDIPNLLPPNPHFDIFIHNLKIKTKILKRLTDTPFADETNPYPFDSEHIAYLGDANGVKNRYLAKIDSIISTVDTVAHYRYTSTVFPVSNFPRNIESQDIVLSAGKMSEAFYSNGKYKMYVKDIATPEMGTLKLKNAAYIGKGGSPPAPLKKDDEPEILKPKLKQVYDGQDLNKNNQIDIDNYIFEEEATRNSPKKEKEQKQKQRLADDTLIVASKPAKADSTFEFVIAKQRNYEIVFHPDYVVSQLDNNFINSNYQKFTGGGAVFFNPGFSGLFKIGMKDVMEDYRIVGGARLSGDLNSNEYFLSFQDLKRRVDKEIIFHRQSFLNVFDYSVVRIHTHNASYSLKYPLNEVAALKGTLLARNDRTVVMSTDLNNLQARNQYSTLAGLKGEFTFDNTLSKGLNLYNGTRYKLWAEFYTNVDARNQYFTVLGFDYRKYIKIHRDLIWANRFATSTSFGRQKLVYYLGGVDNWFLPKFDHSINIATDQNYQYQSIATNMRGFYQNIRNGNTFALINSELRLPVFKYLMNRPIKSEFISNFQIIGFGDIGSAWTGATPYSKDNSLNLQTIVSGPMTIHLKNNKEPIVGGYGMGVRTKIFGYFVRVDYAWGIEDGLKLPPIFYFSLSLDF